MCHYCLIETDSSLYQLLAQFKAKGMCPVMPLYHNHIHIQNTFNLVLSNLGKEVSWREAVGLIEKFSVVVFHDR